MLLLLSLIACSGSPAGSGGCDPSDEPTVTIGTGESEYEPHESGDTAELVRGPQGGVHITLAVETTGFAIEEDLNASFEGEIDGVLVGQSFPFVFLRCNQAEDTQQAWGLRLIYDDDPENLDDQLTDVSVELTDADGRTATAQTTFVIDDPSI